MHPKKCTEEKSILTSFEERYFKCKYVWKYTYVFLKKKNSSPRASIPERKQIKCSKNTPSNNYTLQVTTIQIWNEPAGKGKKKKKKKFSTKIVPKNATKNVAKTSTKNELKTSTKNVLKTSTKNVLKTSTKNVLKISTKNVLKISTKNVLKISTKNVLKTSTKNELKSRRIPLSNKRIHIRCVTQMMRRRFT
ncbi:hypothetical protein, conserved [Plasmodium gonderi]|uniref:Uncharacterized protein n=1 Tax=Plasmodium gonderi TaxID=77519 RepID=A0A1Y1JIC9_PLAGO|nr:hypothetical protein, conserved [Plasmodium gonderi]GAW79854.1 hypothetical protein, conserved [Plasmodium gonderi]